MLALGNSYDVGEIRGTSCVLGIRGERPLISIEGWRVPNKSDQATIE